MGNREGGWKGKCSGKCSWREMFLAGNMVRWADSEGHLDARRYSRHTAEYGGARGVSNLGTLGGTQGKRSVGVHNALGYAAGGHLGARSEDSYGTRCEVSWQRGGAVGVLRAHGGGT